MDPVSIHKLVEKAKAEASAVGATAPHEESLDPLTVQAEVDDELISRLSAKLDQMAADEEASEGLAKKAAVDRQRHLHIAKILTAVDVLSEVGR